MWIYDIPRNSDLVLTVKDTNTTLDFKTKAREPIGNNGIWVDIIRTSQGKTIDFKGRKVSLALNRKGRKPVVWDRVVVKMLKVNGELRQAIVCSAEGEERNRRQVYRHPLNMVAEGNIGGDSMTLVVRDAGATGFSILADAKSVRHGTGVQVECKYMDADEKIVLTGKVVRVEEMPDGAICYGCKYTGRTDVMVAYIRRKKQEVVG